MAYKAHALLLAIFISLSSQSCDRVTAEQKDTRSLNGPTESSNYQPIDNNSNTSQKNSHSLSPAESCKLGDKTYQNDESFMNNCNTCWCNLGVIQCTKMHCNQ